MEGMMDRMLVHTREGKRIPLDLQDIYWIEARGKDSRIRLRGSEALYDKRPLGDLTKLLSGRGFLRIHRNHIVNLRRILEIRHRGGGRDWEVKLEPPVNRVLPVSRGSLRALWEDFGEA